MATARAGRHDGTTWVPSSSSCRSGCRLTAPRRSRAFAQAYLRRLATAADDDGARRRGAVPRGRWAPSSSRPRATAPRWRCGPSTRPAPSTATSPAARSLETNTEDLPFLVDSVSAELEARGLGIVRVLHPIVGTERVGRRRHRPRSCTPAGRRRPSRSCTSSSTGAWRPRSSPTSRTRCARCWPTCAASCATSRPLRERVEAVDRGRARGRRALRRRTRSPRSSPSCEWLARRQLHLPRRARLRAASTAPCASCPGSGPRAARRRGALGLRQARWRSSRSTRACASARSGGELLLVSKTNRLSPVHRRARMDYVGVRRVVARRRDRRRVAHASACSRRRPTPSPRSETPAAAPQAAARSSPAEDLIEGSHDYKAAVSLFDSFPKDELLRRAHRRTCAARSSRCMGLQAEQGRVLGRRDADGRSASIIVALPKGALRRGAARAPARASCAGASTPAPSTPTRCSAEGDRVRVHFTVHRAQGGLPELSRRDVEAEILELARTWDDRARDELVARHGEERGRVLAKRWTERLPDSYKAAVDPAAAADDIGRFERLFTGGEAFHVGLRNEPDGLTRIGLYRVGDKVELSQAMPMLEHLGLRVVEERPTRLRRRRRGDCGCRTSASSARPTGRSTSTSAASASRDCIAAVWRGEAESDSLNRLVINAGLDWRRVAILRAYRKYRQRIGSRFTESYQNDVIAANPHITAKLIRALRAALRPGDRARRGGRGGAARGHPRGPRGGAVARPRPHPAQPARAHRGDRAHERLPARRGARSPSSCARPTCPAIPQPPPLFEIYVYAPEVEGIHLRGGKIARGGLRWSDRMDYRTEVFGLMRAQMTKNAVIVPDGAKGGFYLRRRPDDPAALKAEVERGYVTFISGLLDLTDNLVEGEVVHPEGVRVLDDDDTYLVVAADKGTATFSDTANRVAGRYGFWLGDAFASGGSKGYDHKALGITARGAWESLKRHFRELDMDPAVDEFTAVGIGDMSGDVFGNGMLLSDKIRLVAAYDHRHVFIDPDPDAAKGFAERKRLFELAGSSLGRLRPRRDLRGRRRVAAQRQAHRAARAGARGARHRRRACSRRPRSSARSCARRSTCCGTAASARSSRPRRRPTPRRCDRSSDAIRVDATELRCRVVAEGGNLGLTQRARIEFAREGGLINADFIDNSAGVDCSDHEVNLKVLLDLAVRRGELDAAGRDALLAEVTDDVAAHVLYDSFLQAQMLAQEVRGSATRMFAYEDLMAALEAEGLLHREVEFLPSSEEMADRRRSGRGLERPELAVLLAYAKRSLTGALLRSVAARRRLPRRRPARLLPAAPSSSASATCSAEHPLRRELVATIVSNHVVDALGPDLRLAPGRRAGRRAGRRRARLPHRARRHRRRAALGGDRAARRGVDRQAQWKLHGGRRRARRGHGALVPGERRAGPTWARRSPTGARASGGWPAILAELGTEAWREAPRAQVGRARRAAACPRDWPARTPTCRRSARARRHRGRPAPRALGRGRRARLRRCWRTASRHRVDRGAARRAAGQHADAALGAAGAARRPLARAARPRRSARWTTSPGAPVAGRGRGASSRRAPTPWPRLAGLARTMAGEGGADLAGLTPGRQAAARARELRAALARQPRAHDEAAARSVPRAARRRTARRARASRSAPARRRRRRRGPMRLATSTSRRSGDQRRVTRAWPRPPCLSALVRPSCTSRKAVRSTPGASGPARPRRAARRRGPASRERATSAPRRSSDGCGACSASWPSGRRMPSRRRISVSASRPVVSTAPSARDRGVGVAVQHAPRRSGLDDHDRDVVRDDVVQLARDPRALGEHRRAVALGALALELAALLVETPAEVPARTQDPAQGERLARRRPPPRARAVCAQVRARDRTRW